MAGDPYADIYRRNRERQEPVARPRLSLVEQTIIDDRDEELRLNAMVAPPPEQVARETRIAREAGIEPAMIDDVDAAEKAQQANRTAQVLGKYPAFGRWASANPRGAATAADDHESLGLLGRAWEVLAGRGQQTTQMTGKMGWGSVDYFNDLGDALAYPVEAAIATVGRPFGVNIDPDKRRAKQRAISQGRINATDTAIAAADARAQTGNYWIDAATSGLASLAPSLAALGMGIATRNPGAAAGFMGIGSGGASYAEARTRGLSLAAATPYVAVQGGTEFLTERIPAGALVEAIAKKAPFGKTLVRQLGEEIKGENIATVVQDLTDWVYLPENADKTIGDYIRERPQAALDTTLATIGGTTAQTSIITAADRSVRAAAKLTDRVAQTNQARREGQFIDKFTKAVQGSKLNGRDPEAYAELVTAQAEESGATHIYIDGEAVRALYQSDSYDPDSDPFAIYEEQAFDPAGGDLVIQVGEAVKLVASPSWAALRNDMRLTAGGVTNREADDFDSAMEQVMVDLTDEMAEREKGDAQSRTAIERLTDGIAAKFANAGLSAPNARDVATLLATRGKTRAERLGWDVTGNEYDALEVRSVLPDAVKPFVTRTEKGVDVSPDLINEVKAKRGPSLLEFVAKRGGISDPGGDLRSMGFAPLKGKAAKGQRKVINDSADAVDRVFEAAIEAGYFPDILGTAQERYADLPDPAIFLEALDREYRGAPVYAAGQATEAANAVRAILEQAGYDPAKMSAKDIRDVIAEFEQRDGRPGYEQDLFDAENATDPAKAEAAKQRLKLRAEAPLRGENRTGKAQDGTMGLGLFDNADQPGLLQEYGEGARGRIIFDQNKAIIELFQSRNLSTPLHELSHLWLEELRFDASLDSAPAQIKADWQTVTAWFAANGHPIGDNGQIPTEAHELWARSGERYLMEGKAPSTALQRLFDTFRGWLTAIYKTVDKLRAPISPEIREVFDRLIATDEEIAAANERQNLAALFKSAADAAMSAPEFEAYQAQVQQARTEAQGKLLDKTMARVRRARTKEWNDEAANVREQVTADVEAVPLFRALRAMKTDRISEEWVKAEGFDIAALPKRVPPLTKPGGADPELIAEHAGFPTAGDMLRAIIEAEAAHRAAKEGGDPRSMRARVIEDNTQAEMTRRHGDALNDGTIEREALEAVHNDMQGEVIASELRALSRKTGNRATPYALAKDWARNRIRSGKVVDEASPSAIQRYARAAAKAGREAEAAMLKGDADETFRQKQFQMLNNALVSQAKQAADEVDAAVKRMARVAKAKTMKSVDQDYLEQAQALLEEVDLRRRSQVSQDRKESFEEWAKAKYDATGEEVYIPSRFEYKGTNWSRLRVEMLLGLDDTIKSIMHLGRRKNELQLGKDKRDYNEARGEWLGNAEPLADRPAGADRNPQRSKLRGLFSNMVRIDMMAKIMDNGDPNGLMTRVLAIGAKLADNTYARLQKQVMEPIADAYMAMKGNRLHARVTAPEWIDYRTGQPSTFLRSDLMAIAANLGNESSLRKMIAGEALLFKGQEQNAPTLEGIEQLLARELNEAEWNMVILAGRRVESMWPEIVADERERSGLTPEKVEPRMVRTPFGEVEGWYWPAVYDSDPVRAAAAGINLAEYKASDLETTLGLVGRGVATNKGHTISRTDFVAPMYLNFEGVLFGHVNQVAKRIAYQTWGMQALKIIRDPKIKAMWARKLGEEYHDQLEPWLRDTINQGVVANTGHLADFNGVLKQTRMNLTIMGLVMRFTTLIVQAGGFTSSAGAIGFRNLMNGYRIVSADYGSAKARIYEASPLMARRINEFDRDQLAALAELSRPRTGPVSRAAKPAADVRDRWNALGFHMIGGVQMHLVDLPTWAGAYAQAMGASEDGGMDMDHDGAVAYADRMVEAAQGAGRPAQLAAIQRAGEATRILTLFYTFFGTQLNYQWEMTQDVRNGRYGKATKTAFWVMVATPLLGGLLADAIRGELPDDDDEDTWLAWVMRKVFFGMFTGIPIVRDFANQKERELGGKYAPDPTAPWVRLGSAIAGGGKDAFAGISQTEWYQDAERIAPFLPDPQEVSDKWIKHTLEAIGFATGTGLGQVATTSQFLADVESGEADPEDVGDWLQGITTGRVKEDAD